MEKDRKVFMTEIRPNGIRSENNQDQIKTENYSRLE